VLTVSTAIIKMHSGISAECVQVALQLHQVHQWCGQLLHSIFD
jgi:hypothetical protein